MGTADNADALTLLKRAAREDAREGAGRKMVLEKADVGRLTLNLEVSGGSFA